MNLFDILAAVALVWAIVSGWRNGLVSQIFSIVGIVAGGLVAYYLGEQVGAMLGIEQKLAHIVGGIVAFVGVLVLAVVASKLLRALFSAIGLGSMDTLLGIVLSAVKAALLVSCLFVAVEKLDEKVDFMDNRHFKQSHTFRPISSISKSVGDWLEKFSKEEL